MWFKKKDPNETKLVYCPKCSRQLEVPASLLGKNGECPYCGEKFIIKMPKRKYRDNTPEFRLFRVFFALTLIFSLIVFLHRVGIIERLWNLTPQGKETIVANAAFKEPKRFEANRKIWFNASNRAKEFLMDRGCCWLKDKKTNVDVRAAFFALESANEVFRDYAEDRLPLYRNYKGSDSKLKWVCEYYVALFECRLKICKDVEKICDLVQDMRVLTFSSDSKREKGRYERTMNKYSSEIAAKGVSVVVNDLLENYQCAVDRLVSDEKEMHAREFPMQRCLDSR